MIHASNLRAARYGVSEEKFLEFGDPPFKQ